MLCAASFYKVIFLVSGVRNTSVALCNCIPKYFLLCWCYKKHEQAAKNNNVVFFSREIACALFKESFYSLKNNMAFLE